LQPDEGKDEMQHRHKSPREFLIARRQSPELLDTIEKSFNKVAVFVNMVIVFSPDNAVFSAGDDRFCVSRRNADDKRVGVVSLVSHNRKASNPAIKAWACVMSAASPPVKSKRTGLPNPSTAA